MRMRGTGIWKRPLAVLAALAVMAAMISAAPVLARAEDGAGTAVFDSGSGESSEVSSVPAEEAETASADAAALEASLFSDENGSLLGAAQRYNLVCFGDFKNGSYGGDVEGKSAIGGTINVNSFTFGLKDKVGSGYGLVWGATSTEGSTFNGNMLYSGGSSRTKALINKNVRSYFGNSTYTFAGYEMWDDSDNNADNNFESITGFTFDGLQNELSDQSKKITTLAQKKGISPADSTFTGTDSTINIFTIDATTLNTYNAIRLDTPEKSTNIINVTSASGKTVMLPGVNGDNDRTHLLWNLSEATTVSNTFDGNSTYSIKGSVLAPNAAFTAAGNGGSFEGTMIVKSFDGKQGSFEGHDYPFEGGNPLPGGDDEEPDFNGEIKVTKKINKDICYANGDPIFTFKLERLDENGDDVAATEYRTVRFSNGKIDDPDGDGMVSLDATFSGLQNGEYCVTEEDALRYQLADKNGITGDSKNVTVSAGEKSAEIQLEDTDEENSDENNNFRTDCDGGGGSDGDHPQNSAHVTFTNEKKVLGYFSHTDSVSNQIRITFNSNESTDAAIAAEPETTEADAPAEDAAGTEQESAAPEETEQPGAAQEEPVNSEPPASAPDPPAESKPPAESPGGGEESEAPGPGGPGESGKQPPKETAAPPESGAEKESG